MAEQPYEHGTMNMAEKNRGWEGFVAFSKWGSIVTAAVVLILVLVFA